MQGCNSMFSLRRLRVLLALLTLVTALIIAGCRAFEPTPTPKPTQTPTLQPIDLAVLYTSDTVGYTHSISAVECG